MTTIQAALNGALVGGLFVVMAVGLSVTWGMMKIINLAHFGMILIGAYLTFQITTSWGLDPILTLVITVPTLFAFGALLQWALDRFSVVEFGSLLVTFGILIITMQVVTNIWSADFQRLAAEANPYATQSVSLGRFVFPMSTLLAFAAAVVIVGGAHLALQRTFPGRAMRAFAQDKDVASAFGIDHRRLGMLLAGVSAASAAVAGMLLALGRSLTPTAPFELIGTVFAVVILGGIGHVVGTLAAGVLIGMVSAVVASVWSPSLSPFVVFSVIVLALLFRPHGLFARGGVR
ncbi:branched-chain amino acid ABC transporter permease [Phytoactinopolyspora endophytica]|uniref:branched-chain amino acid ABC transporter permease n=1 Tax=Phytoactinopolyspora endophytica TaxID=1642495 RepID=UPI00101CC559|nr:branched-chain amino acid ABC transporter permease [Phytoactinopolyspora endophytica]